MGPSSPQSAFSKVKNATQKKYTSWSYRLVSEKRLDGHQPRSEEHTSELQSPCISYAVFCLKKKTQSPWYPPPRALPRGSRRHPHPTPREPTTPSRSRFGTRREQHPATRERRPLHPDRPLSVS